MDFALSEEARLMAGAVAGLLADSCTTAQLRALLARGDSFDRDRWGRLVAMGLPGALVPEAAGGLGLPPADFAPLAEACGAALLPEPLVEMAGITLPLLAEAGERVLLARALAGEATVALVHPRAPFALHAARAAAVVLVEPSRIRLAPTGALRITPRESLDPFRPIAEVAAAEGAETLAEGTAAAALSARAADRGALWSAAQMLGMGQRCIDLAAAFVQGRHQFGRPVGSFQAVKHHLASAQVRVELARPVLAAASAQSPGAGPATAARIAHAKLACGTAAEAAACAAIQVHGAMGYSWEVDLHFHLKRILALSAAWGTPAELRATVATRIFAAPPGPETLFPEEDARG